MIDDRIIVSLISAIAGILVAFITTRYKVREPRPKSKDRIDYAFNAYERIIKQLEGDNQLLRERVVTLESQIRDRQ